MMISDPNQPKASPGGCLVFVALCVLGVASGAVSLAVIKASWLYLTTGGF